MNRPEIKSLHFGGSLDARIGRTGVYHGQGPTGSCFQLRDGSGSGIGKNFGFGFGYGSGSGISTAFLSIGYYRVLKILIGYFPDKVLSFGSTKVLAA